MKKTLICILSIILAILMCALPLSASAAERNEKGEYMIKFTNTLDWNNIYVYAWDYNGESLTGEYPGWKMEGTLIETNPEGHGNYMLYLPGDAAGFVVSNGLGQQTNVITDFDSVEGIWVSSEQNDEGNYIAYPWISDYNPDYGRYGDDGGDPYPYDDIYTPGDNTIYLNPGNYTSYGTWYVWSYNGNSSGAWISGEEDNGLIRFDTVASNCIFVLTSGNADWDSRIAQSEDGFTEDGRMFTITDEYESDDGFGYPIMLYSGYWDDVVFPDNSDLNSDITTSPAYNETTEASTQPAQPVTEPAMPVTEPATIKNNGKEAKVTTTLSSSFVNSSTNEDHIYITYNLTASKMIEDGQGTLTYDSSKLELIDFDMPNIKSSLAINQNLENKVKFNFTGIDSKTKSGKADFKNGGVFAVAEFKKLSDINSSTDVNLIIEDLNALENNEEIEYISNSRVSPDGEDVFSSISNPYAEINNPNEKGVKISSYLNDTLLTTKKAEESIVITYNMTAPMLIEDGQGTLTYDSNKLQLVDFSMPLINRNLLLNQNIHNTVKFNFTGINNNTNSGIFNFKDGGIFAQAEFKVVSGASGSTAVKLRIEELDALEQNNEITYFENGTVTENGKTVFNSLTAPKVETDIKYENGVKVSALFNSKYLKDIQAENTFKIAYNLTSPMLLEDGQGTLIYDSAKLKLIDFKMPNINSSAIINTSIDGMVKYNFTGVNSSKNSGLFDFKNGGIFAEAEFKVVEGAWGSTNVNLIIDELDALENGNGIAYFTNGVASPDASGTLLNSLYNPTFILGKDEPEESTAQIEPESVYPTEAEEEPTEATEEDSDDEFEIVLPTEAVTDAPIISTKPETITKKIQKITAKNYTKTYGNSKFSLNAKTSGDGKLSYKSSKKSVATVSSSGKVTIKGCGKTTITITATETDKFKSASKKITVTVKPAKIKIKSVTAKNNKITLNLNKQTGISGYNMQVSMKSDFKVNLSTTLKGSKTKVKISGVSSGNRYYVRIRAFVKIDGEKVYSKWKTINVKVK